MMIITGSHLWLIFISMHRGPKLPTGVKILIFKTVRSRENQAVLQDNKTSNNHIRGRLWDTMTEKVNQACFFVDILIVLLHVKLITWYSRFFAGGTDWYLSFIVSSVLPC
jgi:hypothetical protein